ncbi:hypothetical protein, partial [Alicyclobacillus cellulosilyticus]|uniref:hypothetical protein n=1 Tax=Alicyclobacillus cellulosilyticus TaxID=1003997 RepID=UPI00166F2413
QGLKDKFIRLNQAVMKKYDFISKVIQGGLGWEPLLKTQIANLLIANKHQEALDLMMQHPRVTSIFNDSDGKSLYDYAKES